MLGRNANFGTCTLPMYTVDVKTLFGPLSCGRGDVHGLPFAACGREIEAGKGWVCGLTPRF